MGFSHILGQVCLVLLIDNINYFSLEHRQQFDHSNHIVFIVIITPSFFNEVTSFPFLVLPFVRTPFLLATITKPSLLCHFKIGMLLLCCYITLFGETFTVNKLPSSPLQYITSGVFLIVYYSILFHIPTLFHGLYLQWW